MKFYKKLHRLSHNMNNVNQQLTARGKKKKCDFDDEI